MTIIVILREDENSFIQLPIELLGTDEQRYGRFQVPEGSSYLELKYCEIAFAMFDEVSQSSYVLNVYRAGERTDNEFIEIDLRTRPWDEIIGRILQIYSREKEELDEKVFELRDVFSQEIPRNVTLH